MPRRHSLPRTTGRRPGSISGRKQRPCRDITRRPAGVQPGSRTSVGPLRQMALMREIAEAGELPFEMQFDAAGRAVALLADDDLGLAMDQRHVELPFLVFGRAGARLLVGEIVFL